MKKTSKIINNYIQNLQSKPIYKKFLRDILSLLSKKSLESETDFEYKKDKVDCPFINIISNFIYDYSLDTKNLILLLSKPKKRLDLKIIGKFLLEKFDIFKKLSHSLYINDIISFLKIDKLSQGDIIEDSSNKFIIVLQGKIGLYERTTYTKNQELKEFVLYLNELKSKKKETVLKRIEKDNDNGIIKNIIEANYDYREVKGNYRFLNFVYENITYVKSLKEFEYYNENKVFNNFLKETNVTENPHKGQKLIRRKSRTELSPKALEKDLNIKENSATDILKALSPTVICYLTKNDFINIKKEAYKQRLSNRLDDLQSNYLIFKTWDKPNIHKFSSCFKPIELNLGEYLYKQNDIADCFYLITSGTYEVSTRINIGSINNIKKFIMNNKYTVFDFLRKYEKPILSTNYINHFVDYNIYKNKENNFPCNESFFEFLNSTYKKRTENQNYLLEIKLKEKDLKNPLRIIDIKFQNINKKECAGLGEMFECKRRFCNIKCISSCGKAYKIMLNNLLEFYRKKSIDLLGLEKSINERKMIILNQIYNSVDYKFMNLSRKLEFEYCSLISNEDKKNDNFTKCLNNSNSFMKNKNNKSAISFNEDNNLLKETDTIQKEKEEENISEDINDGILNQSFDKNDSFLFNKNKKNLDKNKSLVKNTSSSFNFKLFSHNKTKSLNLNTLSNNTKLISSVLDVGYVNTNQNTVSNIDISNSSKNKNNIFLPQLKTSFDVEKKKRRTLFKDPHFKMKIAKESNINFNNFVSAYHSRHQSDLNFCQGKNKDKDKDNLKFDLKPIINSDDNFNADIEENRYKKFMHDFQISKYNFNADNLNNRELFNVEKYDRYLTTISSKCANNKHKIESCREKNAFTECDPIKEENQIFSNRNKKLIIPKLVHNGNDANKGYNTISIKKDDIKVPIQIKMKYFRHIQIYSPPKKINIY